MKTKKRFSKIIAMILSLALVLGTTHFSLVVEGSTVAQLVTQINSWNHNGIVDIPLKATASGNTITVTGEVYLAKQTLELNINEDVTVIWAANLSFSSTLNTPLVPLMSLKGSGTFNLNGGLISGDPHNSSSVIRLGDSIKMNINDGGWVLNQAYNESYTINVCNTSTLTMNGGEISSSSKGISVISINSNPVSVKGGKISCSINSPAIDLESRDGNIIISGGTIECKINDKPVITNQYSKVFVIGGTVKNKNQTGIDAIYAAYPSGPVVVWNNTGYPGPFDIGTNTGLVFWPAFVNAKWDIQSGIPGMSISYIGMDRCFIPIPGVTVQQN